MKPVNCWFLVLLGMIFIGSSGCQNNHLKKEGANFSNHLSQKDPSNKNVFIPEKIEKIVSLSPSITEILEDLERLDQIIAVDSQSMQHNQQLQHLPQFDMMNVNVEQLLMLEPDVIFITDLNYTGQEDTWQKLIDAGICVLTIPTSDSIKKIQTDIQFIADSLSNSAKGTHLIEEMNQEIQKIQRLGQQISVKKNVYFEVSAAPDLYSCGQSTYLNEMIEIIGAKNVFIDKKGWFPLSEEKAITSNPEIILTNINYIEDPREEILHRPGWQEVAAVKSQQVFLIDPATSSVPNHRIIKALKQMAKAVYPNEYAEINE